MTAISFLVPLLFEKPQAHDRPRDDAPRLGVGGVSGAGRECSGVFGSVFSRVFSLKVHQFGGQTCFHALATSFSALFLMAATHD